MARDLALLIIDVQAGMFSQPEEPYRGREILEVIAHLAEHARAAAVPVIYIRHDGGAGDPLARGTSGWQIHLSIAPNAGEQIVEKRYSNSFQETDLREILDSRRQQADRDRTPERILRRGNFARRQVARI